MSLPQDRSSLHLFYLSPLIRGFSASVTSDCSIRLVQRFLWTPTMLMLRIKATMETPCSSSLSEGIALFISHVWFLCLFFITYLLFATRSDTSLLLICQSCRAYYLLAVIALEIARLPGTYAGLVLSESTLTLSQGATALLNSSQ